ncbi:MAG: 1-(5-phosphoribosyl)-5-[Selenomonadaceae bacterium]|nr:1-(5-phosphoribosyl)-5-[(5-phosphoribosylamino)methylideneamino]imidazole-4-carboxamide isomerase [Selenomonadaceae bacterium]
MMILPAVDIRGGKCVRLTQGDFKQEIIYSNFPEEQALKWQEMGAEFLHVVDLDGAKEGTPTNIFSIKKILDVVEIPIEVGGGIRTMSDMENLLDMGVERIILGSIAVEDPDLLQDAAREFGGEKIVVGIDARDGIVAVHGWGDSGYIKAEDLAMQIGDFGISTIIYTDISRDGMLSGVDAEVFADLARKTGISIIASGGVGSLDDIRELKKFEDDGIVGVIVGKAIYENKINLAEAVEIAK